MGLDKKLSQLMDCPLPNFIGGGNRSTQEKTTDLPQVPDKYYQIMLYTSPWEGFELTTSVAIETDCSVSCKSNYPMITATTPPFCYFHWLVYIINFSITYNTIQMNDNNHYMT